MTLPGLVSMLFFCAALAGAGDNSLRLCSVEQQEYVMADGAPVLHELRFVEIHPA